MTRFADPFHLISKGIMYVSAHKIPGTAYNRAIKGSKIIRQELLAVIKQKKNELSENKGTVAGDLLTYMLLASDENGRVTNHMYIASRFIGLLLAGHDTTSSAIKFVVQYLAEFPNVYSEVLKGTS